MHTGQLMARVFESLDHARSNGYEEFLHLPAEEVADDLADYDAELEGEDVAEMARLVTAWRDARGITTLG